MLEHKFLSILGIVSGRKTFLRTDLLIVGLILCGVKVHCEEGIPATSVINKEFLHVEFESPLVIEVLKSFQSKGDELSPIKCLDDVDTILNGSTDDLWVQRSE